jgi:tetratricopeptide (TPR) repeat protein
MSTEPTDAGLDADELLHLAMKAMEAGDQGSTLAYLKRAVALAPQDGRIHYLLGAVHAELGMHDRAVEELTRATELAPHLETAHFQLGLLHAARGDLDRALRAWEPLEAFGANPALQRFRAGVVHLANEEYEACIEAVRDGIARNQEYAALNDDMARLIARAEAALADAGIRPSERLQAGTPEHAPAAKEDQHVLLNRYQTRSPTGS